MPGGHAVTPEPERFRRALTITIVVLIAICGVFAGLGYFQGPKLSDADLDVTAATAGPGQQLRLFASQTLAAVDGDQVSVTPDTPLTVSSENDVITIQFEESLRNATDYEVEVRDVTSAYQSARSTLTYRFETAGASLYYLDRADPAEPSGQDQIIRGDVDGGRTTVVSSPMIQDYLVFDAAVVVATLESDESSAVTVVDPDSGVTERLTLPGAGTLDLLQGSRETGVLGFTFSSDQSDPAPEYLNDLFSVDLTGSADVRPVLGLSGEPLEVLDWEMIPGTTTGIAQLLDQSFLLVDLTGASPPLPLGAYQDLGRVSDDGSQVAVGTVFGQFALSLAERTETPLPPMVIDGMEPFGGDIQLIGDGTARVQQVAVFDEATGRFSSHVTYQDSESERVLYEKVDQMGSIEGFEVSPNGQYVAVTTIPDLAASRIDGYAVDPASADILTIIVDVAIAEPIASFAGFDVEW